MERKSVDTDKEKLEAFAEEIQKRSQEVDELCKVQHMIIIATHLPTTTVKIITVFVFSLLLRSKIEGRMKLRKHRS